MSSTKFLDVDKWKKAKIMADQVYDTPSAYKSGYIVKNTRKWVVNLPM